MSVCVNISKLPNVLHNYVCVCVFIIMSTLMIMLLDLNKRSTCKLYNVYDTFTELVNNTIFNCTCVLVLVHVHVHVLVLMILMYLYL